MDARRAWDQCEVAQGTWIARCHGSRYLLSSAVIPCVLISKDSDFVDLVQEQGPPPQLIWLTCGNVTNALLKDVMSKSWLKVAALIEAGEAVVELGD